MSSSNILNRIAPELGQDHLIRLLISEVTRLESTLEVMKNDLSKEKERLVEENAKLQNERVAEKEELEAILKHFVGVKASNETEEAVKQAELRLKQQFELEKFELNSEKAKLEKELAAVKTDMVQRNHKWSLMCDWLRKELDTVKNDSAADLLAEETARQQEKLAFEAERIHLNEKLGQMYSYSQQQRDYHEAKFHRILDNCRNTLHAMMAHVGYPVVEVFRDGQDYSCSSEVMLADMLDLFETHRERMDREAKKTEWYRKNFHDLQSWVEKIDPGRSMSESDSSGLPPSPTPSMVPMPSCQICCQEFSLNPDKTPRNLECGHTLCEECVTSIILKSNQSFISCPFDRHETSLPKRTVLDLPKNYSILQLLNHNST